MRIALTANGPGEVAGWVRPLLRRLYELDPTLDAHLFLVPDDYATGGEAATARALFPSAHVYEPRDYVRFALGGALDGAPQRVDVVQYLGGDLMHAARLLKRLGGKASTYKFARPRYANALARAFALDEKNAQQLRDAHAPADAVRVVGNLAIEGALLEAERPVEDGAPEDGILVMPGSRKNEVSHLIPFFYTAALRMVRERPGLRIAFGISPFTELAAVEAAMKQGGHPQTWSERGRLVTEGGAAFLESLDGNARFPLLRNGLAAARRARLVLTLPGTKVIELAALGVPVVSATPMQVPEKIAVNGVLSYVDRIPLVGAPIKRAAILAGAKRFRFFTQPNMDAGEELVRELRGTLTPGRVARVALECYDDRAWQTATGARLRELYAPHAGAAERMARSLLEIA